MAFNSVNYCRTLLEQLDTVIDDFTLSEAEKAKEIASYADELSDTASSWLMALEHDEVNDLPTERPDDDNQDNSKAQ